VSSPFTEASPFASLQTTKSKVWLFEQVTQLTESSAPHDELPTIIKIKKQYSLNGIGKLILILTRF
jgi:hypothetical protein